MKNYITMRYSVEDIKICVYTICKNEEFFAERWLRSAEEADAIFVNDTGSTDNTINILKSHPKVTLIEGKTRNENFRFDYAWNEVLEIIPDTFDFCVRLDMDMMLNCGWYNELRKYLVSLVNDGKFIPSTQTLSLSVFQFERPYDQPESDLNYGNRWTGIVHSHSKSCRFHGAVHEKCQFYDFKDHLGEKLPSYVMSIVHTEKANRNKKSDFYSRLCEKRFKTNPHYLNYILYLGCCSDKEYRNVLELLDSEVNDVSAETNKFLFKMQEGLFCNMNESASRVDILYIQFLVKKFLFEDEKKSKEIMTEIKSLRKDVFNMNAKSYMNYLFDRILNEAFQKAKDQKLLDYIDNLKNKNGIELYDYFIQTFDK